jgi:hypothetical protein
MIEFPEAFVATDRASLEGQRRFVQSLKFQLVLLLIAGATSAIAWTNGHLDIGALVAGVAFLLAALLRLNSFSGSPHQRWYEGRAAAESVKTLSWRFAVGGDPFPVSLGDEAVSQLASHVDDITRDLASLERPTSEPAATESMRALRADDLDTRKAAYLTDRIEDQQRWYEAKASWNRARESFWSRVVLAAEVLGALGAFLVGFGLLEIDLFGLAGALAAVSAAWLETKQHHALANAYGVAASELASIKSLGSQAMSEEEWARFVSESEEAISREHTLWRARTSKD